MSMNPEQNSTTCIERPVNSKWYMLVDGSNDTAIRTFHAYTYVDSIDESSKLLMKLVCNDPPNSYSGRKTDAIRRDKPKIGRNASCLCGSGLKYKKCCMDKEQKP
jgi:hypothetical protein